MPLNPLDLLGQIVTDMHRIALRGRDCPDDPVTYRDVAQLTGAMCSLAEAVLTMQARLAAEQETREAIGRVTQGPLTNAHAAIRKEQD